MSFSRLIKPYRVTDGARFRLKSCNPADTHGLAMEKKEAQGLLAEGVERLKALQERLYASNRWAVLAIFQAMDAAGKDGAIKHVMSGINPQGCQVYSFKAPSEEELDHDFLWRTSRALPERGRIGIFNRSYYEEVLVVRVHRELLLRQKLPAKLIGAKIWQERLADISAFEGYLARNGILPIKFFLHVSKAEQKRRFLERIDDPAKNWKFQARDVEDRGHWSAYMTAYEEAIRATATPAAPWYVVPADNKWFARLIVAGAMVDAMEKLDLAFPALDPAAKRQLMAARRQLMRE